MFPMPRRARPDRLTTCLRSANGEQRLPWLLINRTVTMFFYNVVRYNATCEVGRTSGQRWGCCAASGAVLNILFFGGILLTLLSRVT